MFPANSTRVDITATVYIGISRREERREEGGSRTAHIIPDNAAGGLVAAARVHQPQVRGAAGRARAAQAAVHPQPAPGTRHR